MRELSLVENIDESLSYDIKKIKRELCKVTESFFYIGLYLYEIRESGNFGIYKNIYELCATEFDLKPTTVKNLINCFIKYRLQDKYVMSGLYKDYQYSQLVEMLPLSKEIIFFKINSRMTVSEIREIKRSICCQDYDFKNCQTSDQNDCEESSPISSDIVTIQISGDTVFKLEDICFRYGLFVSLDDAVRRLIDERFAMYE